jgi:uncharacterized iron-regulated membrane protein
MKLTPHAFTRFWDVHAWAGVIGGLVLYLMFLTGSITLFHEQVAVWEEPLAQRIQVSDMSLQATLERGLAAAGPTRGEVWFHPPRAEYGTARLTYQSADADTWKTAWIDTHRGALVPERERLSSFLYSIHFLWHDATGNWLYYAAGALAAALLLALVTGVLIHLKDMVRQFHQFRPDRSRRVLWSDMHKVLGVMGLPFQLMYAYTGAFIVLGPLVLSAFTSPVFGGDRQRAEAVAWSSASDLPAVPGARANVLLLDDLVARARAIAPTLRPEAIAIMHHGHENGVARVHGMMAGTPGMHGDVYLRQLDGKCLHLSSPSTEGSAGAIRRWLLGLHYAYFGGLVARFLFFALGLATCVTVLTGNWIWLARREARRMNAGNRVLARLTTGFGVGTPLAVAAMFLVSRLLPLEWSARGSAEELTFMGVLSICLAWSFAARDEATVWWQGLAAAGAALLPVPLLAARWSDAGLFGSGPRIGAVIGVDVAVLAASFALLVGALALRVVPVRQRAGNAEAAGEPATARDLMQVRAERDGLGSASTRARTPPPLRME